VRYKNKKQPKQIALYRHIKAEFKVLLTFLRFPLRIVILVELKVRGCGYSTGTEKEWILD